MSTSVSAEKTLCCGEVADVLVVVLARGHGLEHVEVGAGEGIAEHLEVSELEHRLGLDLEVAGAHFVADLVHDLRDILGLILATMRAQALDERGEGALEHAENVQAAASKQREVF